MFSLYASPGYRKQPTLRAVVPQTSLDMRHEGLGFYPSDTQYPPHPSVPDHSLFRPNDVQSRINRLRAELEVAERDAAIQRQQELEEVQRIRAAARLRALEEFREEQRQAALKREHEALQQRREALYAEAYEEEKRRLRKQLDQGYQNTPQAHVQQQTHRSHPPLPRWQSHPSCPASKARPQSVPDTAQHPLQRHNAIRRSTGPEEEGHVVVDLSELLGSLIAGQKNTQPAAAKPVAPEAAPSAMPNPNPARQGLPRQHLPKKTSAVPRRPLLEEPSERHQPVFIDFDHFVSLFGMDLPQHYEKPKDSSRTEQQPTPKQGMKEATRPSASQPEASSSGTAHEDNEPKPDIPGSLAAINRISASFEGLVSTFQLPDQLDFTPTPSRNSSPVEGQAEEDVSTTSKLAYTPNNTPVRIFENSLSKLLTDLDGVESYGDEEVRKARKGVVEGVKEKLEEVEREVHRRWRGWNDQKVDQEQVVAVAATQDTVQTTLPADASQSLVEEGQAQDEDYQPTSSPDAEDVPVSGDDSQDVEQLQASVTSLPPLSPDSPRFPPGLSNNDVVKVAPVQDEIAPVTPVAKSESTILSPSSQAQDLASSQLLHLSDEDTQQVANHEEPQSDTVQDVDSIASDAEPDTFLLSSKEDEKTVGSTKEEHDVDSDWSEVEA